ncbi:helix-turn-helix domain-containing protein [Streptomyces nodosus]|uniref:DNA-binding protein n=1 Tax=Streptomyces nodosus TaxID=40318 RepID=A0A0B5DJP7_9ACTN|nr:helix-turn-helix domain-containing protein [Streptomyces nodosus]AJE43908.1 DNA-binding protein [Streptomyces nodosus]MBB4795472.1 sugar diacid utilization regulator [Streptomyces nodosus]QEV42411.1 PucR family transcriptional regulator [Streptomyces nodosus]
MPTLGSLPADKPELELTLVAPGSAPAASREVTGVLTVTPELLLEGGVPATLPEGSLILITGADSFVLRGRITTVLDLLLKRMSRDASVGLVVRVAPGARRPFPQAVVDEAARLSIPLLITTAAAETWEGVHEEIQRLRLTLAERRATQLGALVQELPTQLADPRALQRIVDWLARVLEAQVLVSEPERVLVAAPATAAEHLAQAVIRQSVDGATAQGACGPHTQLVSLSPVSAADTVLAVARRTPFDEADLRLLRYAAKLLGLVDQATREYRAASDASRAARTAAFELLLDGEVAKARRVMANLAPGLLEAETARVFVIETQPGRQDATVRRCDAAMGRHSIVVSDRNNDRRVLIAHPIPAGHDISSAVSDELTSLVHALGPHCSLGGSGIYSMGLLADALHEAITAQKFAALQPDSVALSVHASELVTLLPQPEAQHWARYLLVPLMEDPGQWRSVREALPTALAHPYTVAARRLQLHRNTIQRRVARAAELLRMNLNSVSDRIAVALAMELVTQREASAPPHPPTSGAPRLTQLLAAPQVRAWSETLLKPAQEDRRDLLTTAQTWLSFDTHVEPAARQLELSEVTVRSHLRALEKHMQRDFRTLTGVRDLMFSLHVVEGRPITTSDQQCEPLRAA